ncbi:MFS transporter [Novosphingobium rosa]|uniref:MFS transporter n=1 Tax=Novosphingobium rosa TaxID=76978 RepID=UPI00082FCBAA|nr:MFS transporter [Novosphingobium rosa]
MAVMMPVEGEGGADRKPVSGLFIVAYVLAQFGVWVALLTPLVLTIALRVGDLAGPEYKALMLGRILALGSAVSVVATPLAGMLSDRTTSRWGRRRPWIVGGAMVGLVGLAICGGTQDLLVLAAGWVLCQAGFNAMQVAVMAILPDAVPFSQQGRVSGFLGVTTTAAIFAGTWLSQFSLARPMQLMLAPFVLTLICCGFFVVLFREEPVTQHRETRAAIRDLRGMIAPFLDWDFNFTFLSRYLIMTSWAVLLSYQLYFLTDHLALSRAASTAVMVKTSATTAIATVLTSLIGGWISDLIGRRKPLVFLSAAIEASGFFVIATSHSVDGFVLGVGLAAAGKGFYFGVDLALVAAVLPDPKTAARDLGLFQIANTFPQFVLPLMAPAVLAIGSEGGGNYAMLYLGGGVCSLMGAFAILPLRRVR